jgi:tRNA modification GTPase
MNDLVGMAMSNRTYREGARVAIVGLPNAGKSSLLNALLRRNRAIVTDIPGTTRDTLEEQITIAGAPVTLIDTAGIRVTSDVIEDEGVKRAMQAAHEADAILKVVDLSADWRVSDDELFGAPTGLLNTVVAANKRDVISSEERRSALLQIASTGCRDAVAISAKTGEGIEELEKALAHSLLLFGIESSTISSTRHIMALDAASESLNHALETLNNSMPADFVSIDLRGALDAIGQITGETATQEVIDRIFRDFCIGK